MIITKPISDYENYIWLQGAKARTQREALLASSEKRQRGFCKLFGVIGEHMNPGPVLCLGARTGCEVKAAVQSGFAGSVGIDLHPIGANVVAGDWHNMPFKDGQFPNIFTNSLDHCGDFGKLVAEIKRVLPGEGRFVFAASYGDRISTPIEQRLVKQNKEFLFWEHPDELRDMFVEAGFKCIAQEYIKNECVYVLEYQMVDVVCWKWRQPEGYRSKFAAENVNILRNMVKRNLKIDHRFSCITDEPDGIDPDIRIIPLWSDFADVNNPSGRGPSCYRRLKAFAPEAKELIGSRILSLDLDCVVVDDITPLVDRPEDFVCWGDTAKRTHYNGGFWLLRAGTRTQVWDTFDPQKSPQITSNLRIVGSDQAWISYIIDGKDPKWTQDDGVVSYRNQIQKMTNGKLPAGARIVFFHGQYDPWDDAIMRKYHWVRENYR